MKLVTRGQWGARAPKSITRISGPVTSVTDHWEGPKRGEVSHDKCASLVRGIQNFHMDRNGWSDLAYTAVICWHGHVFEGRWLGVRSAANGTNTGNSTSYAVCGLRGETDPLNEAMKQAFVEVHTFFKQSTVHPHSKWFATSCPGDEHRAWLAAGRPLAKQEPVNVFAADDPVPSDRIVGATFFETDETYWMFGSDGGVFSVGVPFFGSLAHVRLHAPIVWGGGLPDKSGYFMVGADGGIFCFGAAPVINPYLPLMSEYANAERRIVTASLRDKSLVLVSNLGERYRLS